LKRPCNECPFLRTATRGWLGGSHPQDFLDASLSDASVVCHKALDHRRHDALLRSLIGPRCAGAAMMRGELVDSNGQVFANKEEFLKYHDPLHGTMKDYANG